MDSEPELAAQITEVLAGHTELSDLEARKAVTDRLPACF